MPVISTFGTHSSSAVVWRTLRLAEASTPVRGSSRLATVRIGSGTR